MKRKILYISLFLLSLCINIDFVKASTSKECYYKGQVYFTNGTSGTGTNFNETVGVGIKYTCEDNGKCSSEYSASYTDKNRKSQSISFTNAKEFFGPNKGNDYYSNKQISCPGNVVVARKDGDKFSFNYKCPSGESSNGKCLGVASKLDNIEAPDGSSLQERTRSITDKGDYYAPSGAVTPATEPEKEKNHSENHDSVGEIKKDGWGEEDYGISEDEAIDCTSLLGDDNIKLITDVLLVISAVGIVMVVVYSIADFTKSVASNDDDGLAKSGKHLKNRIISVIALLLLPALVNFLLGFVNDNLHYEKIKKNGDSNGSVSIKVGNAADCGV